MEHSNVTERSVVTAIRNLLATVFEKYGRNGWWRKPIPEDSDKKNYHLVYKNTQIEEIVQCMPIQDFIVMQHLKYIAHVTLTKRCYHQ